MGTSSQALLRLGLMLLLLLAVPPSLAQVPEGPGAWSSKQTWAADTVNGGNLTGYVYWPSTQPALGGQRALVLVLHGCAQTALGDVLESADDRGYNWKAAADRYGAVILAPDATGNIYNYHCWDYSTPSHSRSAGHDGILLDLVQRYVAMPQYAIDPGQVYVTGLSSGGGESIVLGCMAPEVFAGIGISAGPPPGTTANQIGFVPSGYTSDTAAGRCRSLAGANTTSFATQIASVAWGTSDFVVAQAYGPINAAALRAVYGGRFTRADPLAVPGGGSNVRHTDSNGRLRTSEMAVGTAAHAWLAGAGGQNTNYVNATKVNYPAFLMDFWFLNNLRVSAAAAPVMTSCQANVAGNSVTITGSAISGAGGIGSYRVVLDGTTALDDPTAGTGPRFSIGYALANGYYDGRVTVTDAVSGRVSSPCHIARFLVGPEPAILPPIGLAATGASASAIALAWNAASGASGYNVYRNGVRITASPVAATAFTSTALEAGTSYAFQVSSVAASGYESPLSPTVRAMTQPPFSCNTVRASNWSHVQAGRAHAGGGFARANGSNQDMGLNNIFANSTLAQTAPGYYVIGNCP
jgi:poly(3-hydroxybutyrate) depolymerase